MKILSNLFLNILLVSIIIFDIAAQCPNCSQLLTQGWAYTSNPEHTPSSGVYIYKIQSGDFISSKKMILLK